MSKLKKENGKFIVNGKVVETPEFPLEFHPSSVAMEEDESELYVNELQFKLTEEETWERILPLCPKCKKVARWTDIGNTTIDMTILHNFLFDWVLNHYAEDKIRNADNILIELKCGCKLTVKDAILKCFMDSKVPNNILEKFDYLQEASKKIWNDIKDSDDYKKLSASESEIFYKIREAFDNVMSETMKNDFLGHAPISSEVNSEIKKIFTKTLEDFEVEGYHEINMLSNELTSKGALIARGYCVEFADLLLENLLKVISPERIKIFVWEYIHTFIVMDNEWILDPDMFIVKFSRQKLNEMFMHYVASSAVTLNEHYYIVARNGKAIIFDPWDFVDNQDFDHKSHNVIPSIEHVYSVEKYKKIKEKQNESR